MNPSDNDLPEGPDAAAAAAAAAAPPPRARHRARPARSQSRKRQRLQKLWQRQRRLTNRMAATRAPRPRRVESVPQRLPSRWTMPGLSPPGRKWLRLPVRRLRPLWAMLSPLPKQLAVT